MERFGNVFINKILNMIDYYENKRMYNFLHLNMLENEIGEIPGLKASINKKLEDEQQFSITSETLIIFHRENKNKDFFGFTSLIRSGNYESCTLITYSPGSMYDIQNDILYEDISSLDFQRYIENWKNNVIITKNYSSNDSLYESIYSEITNKYPDSETLDDIYINDEVEILKEELENLKTKVAENEELTKQQLEEFYAVIDDLKNIKPLDTKKQWVSRFMTNTSKFIKKYPTTSSAILFNITNGFSTVHTLPTAYFADQALQLGLPKEDVDKAFKLNE